VTSRTLIGVVALGGFGALASALWLTSAPRVKANEYYAGKTRLGCSSCHLSDQQPSKATLNDTGLRFEDCHVDTVCFESVKQSLTLNSNPPVPAPAPSPSPAPDPYAYPSSYPAQPPGPIAPQPYPPQPYPSQNYTQQSYPPQPYAPPSSPTPDTNWVALNPSDYQVFVGNWTPDAVPLCAVLSSEADWNRILHPAATMFSNKAFAPPAFMWNSRAVLLVARATYGGDNPNLFQPTAVSRTQDTIELDYGFTPPLAAATYTGKYYMMVQVTKPLPANVRFVENGREVCDVKPDSGAWVSPPSVLQGG
jgi:hypothetical protein